MTLTKYGDQDDVGLEVEIAAGALRGRRGTIKEQKSGVVKIALDTGEIVEVSETSARPIDDK